MALPELYTLQRAAGYLNMKKTSHLKDMARNGDISFIEIDKKIYFTEDHIIEFLTKKTTLITKTK